MATVRVTKIGRSQKGKPIVYFDNKHGQTDGYLVSDKCQVPPDQSTIEAKTSSWDYQGKAFWGLNDWKFGNIDDISRNPSKPFVAMGAKTWDVGASDLCKFVSNVVGQAIAAKTLTEPSQVMAWARAAHSAANALVDGSIQVRYEGPDPSTHADDPGREEGDPGFDDSVVPF